mmetsp:Transcript_13349/g.30469  ORF Transcript_13349/g.30469 Transcript_13349/m.30469 type:complete len:253 (-) Transcript_13349:1657-2415(-)
MPTLTIVPSPDRAASAAAASTSARCASSTGRKASAPSGQPRPSASCKGVNPSASVARELAPAPRSKPSVARGTPAGQPPRMMAADEGLDAPAGRAGAAAAATTTRCSGVRPLASLDSRPACASTRRRATAQAPRPRASVRRPAPSGLRAKRSACPSQRASNRASSCSATVLAAACRARDIEFTCCRLRTASAGRPPLLPSPQAEPAGAHTLAPRFTSASRISLGTTSPPGQKEPAGRHISNKSTRALCTSTK